MQNGLSDNVVTSIYKDKDGFMWFGTDNGISRYDGRKFKNFNSGSPYMHVSEICGLQDNYLGIVADNHLFIFDRCQERYIPLNSKNRNIINATNLIYNRDHSFWSIDNDILTLYKIEEEKDKNGFTVMIRLRVENSFKLPLDKSTRLSAFCYSSNRKELYAISTHFQIIHFDIKTKRVINNIRLRYDSYIAVSKIIDSDDMLWISTINRGIVRYHIKTGKTDYITRENTEHRLSHNDVYDLISIGNRRYLAATWGGLTIIVLDKGHEESYTTEIFDNPISSRRYLETRMLTAYYDNSGILWLGTSGGGVLYSDLRTQYYMQFHQRTHNEICQIIADNNRYIWLATYNGGILRSVQPFDRSHKLSFVSAGPPEVKRRTTVLCAVKDNKGILWFGNKDGTLTVINPSHNQFEIRQTVNFKGQANKSPIWSLYIDKRNNFWIGTEEGLLLYDEKKNVFKKIHLSKGLNNNIFIRTITESSDSSIWLGTNNNGLYRMVMKGNGRIWIMSGYEKKLHSMDYVNVRSLMAAKDGNLYVGYFRGFAILSIKKNAIQAFYNTQKGMCSNVVGCIVEDNEGRIWLGNASAISRFSRHQHIFYNYYISGSNRSAMFFDGMLFFGNNKALTYFSPKAVDYYHKENKVFITGLEVANRPVEIGEEVNGQRILTANMSFVKRIRLSNKNKDFSILFNNLSYSEDLQKYEYRLKPYQDYWLVSGESGKASYTNLPDGNYVFEVRSIYPDGSSGPVSSIEVKILPHWSHTIWFRLLVFLVFMGIAYYIIRYLQQRQKRLEHEMQMKNELTKLNMEWEKERQIRTERENFFTGAAHELRTPLTLILSPLSELIHRTNPEDDSYNSLLTMYRNGSSLHTLVDHLLYVQKIEAGMVKLQLSEVDGVKLVKGLSQSFRQLAKKQKIDFQINVPEENYPLFVDVEKISSAIRNLLSNAFKYTPPSGKIAVEMSRTTIDGKEFCTIKVSDTGTGIPLKTQEHIFDSFITGTTMPNFSTKVGIGLRIVKNTMDLHHGQVILKSEPNKGSLFSLYIPFGKDHFANDSYETLNYNAEESLSESMPIPSFIFPPPNPEISNKRRLLIVEDNNDVRNYILSLFSSKYLILEARNGEEGIKVSLESKPDLIISDVMMPVMDGFTCCKAIRTNPHTAHIPILILTAKAEDEDIIHSSHCGADDYMMKPFNPEVLRAKVDNLILQREQLKRIYTKALMLRNESEVTKDKDEFMQEVVNVIEANLSQEDFNVQMLAKQMNMSQPTLYRKMKQRTDMAIIDMIRNVRVAKAASLIMEHRYSIQEISEMVGFSDIRTLRKHFTQQFGVSPSKYLGNNDNMVS